MMGNAHVKKIFVVINVLNVHLASLDILNAKVMGYAAFCEGWVYQYTVLTSFL